MSYLRCCRSGLLLGIILYGEFQCAQRRLHRGGAGSVAALLVLLLMLLLLGCIANVGGSPTTDACIDDLRDTLAQ